jgi:quinol monooxygenase YgiN
MSVTVIIELPAQRDKLEELKDTITAMVPETLTYDGCAGVTMYQNQDESTIVLIEPWASRAHQERYLAWRTERGEVAALVAMLTGPPTIRYFNSVDASSGVPTG